MKNPDRRNKYFFGLGTIGRDMFYAFEANALLYFLSNILSLPIHVFAAVSLVLSVLRIADALNDPITGLVIDNIHTKWGKFKPAILVGGVVSVIFYLILFGNVGTGVSRDGRRLRVAGGTPCTADATIPINVHLYRYVPPPMSLGEGETWRSVIVVYLEAAA